MCEGGYRGAFVSFEGSVHLISLVPWPRPLRGRGYDHESEKQVQRSVGALQLECARSHNNFMAPSFIKVKVHPYRLTSHGFKFAIGVLSGHGS